MRHHVITEKLPSQARWLKRALDQNPGRVESFCRNVQADARPPEAIDRRPLFAAYSLIPWTREGKTPGEGCGFPFDRPHVQFAKRLLVLAEQLEQLKMLHRRELFADPIGVRTPNGRLRIQPQRTNNLLERLFRNFRRGARRKSGQNSIRRPLQTMIADTRYPNAE